jgi:hypothetical protein
MTTEPTPEAHAQQEFLRLMEEIEGLAQRSKRLSAARMTCFLILVAGLIGSAESTLIPLLVSLPALLVFVVLLFRHGSVLDRKLSSERALLLLQEERERRSNRRRARDLPALPSTGAPLEIGLPIYRQDGDSTPLDEGAIDDLNLLSGPRNLFSFLDVSSTEFGARRLRRMLTRVLRSGDEIRRRQTAVEELARRDDVRRRVLEALIPLREASFAGLSRFFDSPAAFAGRRGLWAIAHLFGTAVPVFLALVLVRPEFLAIAFAIAIVNFGIIGSNVKNSNPARDRLLRFGPLLDGLGRLQKVLAESKLESEPLREIEEILTELRPAATRLHRYVTLLGFHDYGVIFEILNVVLLWELRILPPAEAIFLRHRELLEKSAGALGEIEALASLAAPLDEQEGYTIPEILTSDRPRIEAREMGHPLLESDVVVRNDLVLGSESDDEANLIILSGSNMSGKSTYLKSAGINTLLAGVGGPVCARSFRWTPLQVFSDINVRDSLDDGKSYFQVEVERVLGTIRAASADPMLLAVFDELFRGTNADERVALSRSIFRHVRDSGALLLVATHDNALTELVTKDNERGMANAHLRENVREGEMVFDYRIRSGPATTRNAIRVLEFSGYPKEITRTAQEELESS